MFKGAMDDSDIASWVNRSLNNENFVNHDLIISGTTEKGQGYFGEMVFVTVRGTTKDNARKVLHLFIKYGKNNVVVRKVTRIKDVFETEIDFYEKIIPMFRKFQLERNITDGFEAVAKCYITLHLQQTEVIVLDDLRKQGYELHSRMKPLNTNHLKLILKEYGKFHALSFALRDQNNAEFNAIARYGVPLEEFYMNKDRKDAIDRNNSIAMLLLNNRGDRSLVKKLKKLLVKDVIYLIVDLGPKEEPQSVILHGDSWISNFMFKYENNDQEKASPLKVKILDWQLSTLRSPVFDLSFLIYGNSSEEDLAKLEDLLQTYYASFSSFLKELGSNPEQLFTYADLKRHWKKYSVFTILFASTLFRFVYCKVENAPAVETLRVGQDIGNFLSPVLSDLDAYYERLKTVYNHYFEHLI